MTLYSYLEITPEELSGLSSSDADSLIQQRLDAKLRLPDANASQSLFDRSLDKVRLGAYVLSVPELRSTYESFIFELSEQEQKDTTKLAYEDASKEPDQKAKNSVRDNLEDIRPELIRSAIEINFLTKYYDLSDEQIASIVARLPEIKTNGNCMLNLYGQPRVGEKTIQATFDLLRTRPEHAHFALYGMLESQELSDDQLAEIIAAMDTTDIDGYDINSIYLQRNFGPRSFEATKQLVETNSSNLCRYVVQSLLNTNRLSDDQLSELIDVLPDNHDLEIMLDQIARRDFPGKASATSYFNKIIQNNIKDDELIGHLVHQRALSGRQYAQLLTRDLQADRLPVAQRLILQRAVSYPEIKEAFMDHVKEHRELNTEAFEILLGTVGFSDHEFATLLTNTNSRWERNEAEKIYKDHGHRFGPESLDVLIRDVAGIEFRSPQSLERMLYGSTISDSQTAALLEATVGDNESYEMWDVLAEHGTFGDDTFAMMEKLEHKIPNLRPSFVAKLVDSFRPYGIPDHHAATLLRVTKETILASELRQALVDRQQLGQRAFNELTLQFSKTQNVDKQLVHTLVYREALGDENTAQLIEATSHSHAGHEIRAMVVNYQPLGPNTLHALARAMRESQYPDLEMNTVQDLSRKGLGRDEKMIIAGAFENSYLSDRVNGILGVNGSGQNFGQDYRGW